MSEEKNKKTINKEKKETAKAPAEVQVARDNKIPDKEKEAKKEKQAKNELEAEFDKIAAEKEDKKEKKVTVGKKAAKGKKAKIKRQVPIGNVYVKSTYNNTSVTAADQAGNVIAWSSAGFCGFKGPKKATPFAAGIIVKDLIGKTREYGLKDVHVFVQGIGSGREASIRALNANGINVLSIKDVTPIPHNGCRPKKPRRV